MNVRPIKVILDKSFLQAESRDSRRLEVLRDAGCRFVLTDTLIYELCSDANEKQWPATQRKLLRCADSIEVWRHTADLLRAEIRNAAPIVSPVEGAVTESVRKWLAGGEVYVLPDLKVVSAAAHQQREINSVTALQNTCNWFCGLWPDYTARVSKGGSDAENLISDLIARPEAAMKLVKRTHGNPGDVELYIRGAESGLGPDWFAYHNARSTLALCGSYMLKFGLKNLPGRDFAHTKLDSEYLALLHYADGLATNETKGGMSDICRWLYGGSKPVFSTAQFDKALPSDDEIRREAFFRWEREGRKHGRDLADWYWAERDLKSRIWERLGRLPH